MSKSLKPSSQNNEKFDSIISVNGENFTASSRKNLLEKIYSLKKEIEENYKGNILFWHRIKEVKENILFEESENTESENSETEFDQDSGKINLEGSQKVVSNDSFKSLESYDNDFESFNNENDSILSDSPYFKKLSKEEDNTLKNKEGKNLVLKMIEYFPQHQESSLDESKTEKIEIINFENSNDENDNENQEVLNKNNFNKNNFNDLSLVSNKELNKKFEESFKKPLISQNDHLSEEDQENIEFEEGNSSSSHSSLDKSYSSRKSSPKFYIEKNQVLNLEKNNDDNETPEEGLNRIFLNKGNFDITVISDIDSNYNFTGSDKNSFMLENFNSTLENQENIGLEMEKNSSITSSKDKSYYSRINSPSYSPENDQTLDFEKNINSNKKSEEKIKNNFKKNNLEKLSSISDNESNESFTKSFKNIFNSENGNLKEINQEKEDSIKQISSSNNSSKDKSYPSKNNSLSYSSENNETLDFGKSIYENENPEEKIKNSFKENNLEHLSSISDNESNVSFTVSFKNLFNSENENSKEINQEKKDYVKENTLPSGSSCKKSSERSASSDSSEKSISFEISEDSSSFDSLKYSSSSGSSEKAELKNFNPINLHKTDRKENQRLKRSLTSKNLISSKDQEGLFPLKKLKNSSKSLYENHSDINQNSFKATKTKNNSLNSDIRKFSKESDLSNINNISIETKNRSGKNLIPSKKSENLGLFGDKEIHNNNLVRIKNKNLSSANGPVSKGNASSNNEEKFVFVQKNDEEAPMSAQKTEKEEKQIFVQSEEKPEQTDQLDNNGELTFDRPEINTPDKIDELNDTEKKSFLQSENIPVQDDQLDNGKQTFVQPEFDTPGQAENPDNNGNQYFILKESNATGSVGKSENQGTITLFQPKFDTPEKTNQLTNTGKLTFVQQESDSPEKTNLSDDTEKKIFVQDLNTPEETQDSKNLGKKAYEKPGLSSNITQQLKNFREERNLKSDAESKLTNESESQGKLTFVQPEEKIILGPNKIRSNAENILKNREMKRQNNCHNIDIPKPDIQRNKIQNPNQPIKNVQKESNKLNIVNPRNLEQNPIKNNERISSSPIKGNNSVPLNINKNQSSSVPKKVSGKKENPKKVPVKSRVRSSSGNPDNDPNKSGSSDSLKDSKKKKNNEPQRNKEIIKPNKRVTFNFDNPVIIESPNSRKDIDKRSNLSKGSDKKQEIIAQPEEDLRQGSNNEENSDGIAGNLPKTDVENKWKWWHTVVTVLGGSVLLLVGYYYFVGKNKGVLR